MIKQNIKFGKGNRVHLAFGSSSYCGYWNGYPIYTEEDVTCRKCLMHLKKYGIPNKEKKQK